MIQRFSTIDAIDDVSKSEITDQGIVRLIYAYYANYVEGCDPEKSFSLPEMIEIYQNSQDLLAGFQSFCEAAARSSQEKIEQAVLESNYRQTLSVPQSAIWQSIYPARYQLRMLGDLGATMLLVSDIVSRHVNPVSFPDGFMGIDLGTGSAILLAAQDILARRHGFQTRILHGIELDEVVAQKTSTFTRQLGYVIHQGDTTQTRTWSGIPFKPITCITNENVPAANEPMSQEPFISNMSFLRETRKEAIQPDTVFIPERLEIIKDPKTTEAEVRYICTPENGFCPPELAQDVALFRRAGRGDLYEYLFPDSMTLGGENIPLKLVSKLGAQRLGNFSYVRSYLSRF